MKERSWPLCLAEKPALHVVRTHDGLNLICQTVTNSENGQTHLEFNLCRSGRLHFTRASFGWGGCCFTWATVVRWVVFSDRCAPLPSGPGFQGLTWAICHFWVHTVRGTGVGFRLGPCLGPRADPQSQL